VTDVFSEVAGALARLDREAIDWITFVGSGETTLYSGLGSLIRLVKTISDLPVAVITNGSLLHSARVRNELSVADAVLPSIDAGTEMLWRRINRPRADLAFTDLVDGLVSFRESFPGRLWVEVMLVDSINDSAAALHDIAAVLQKVEPDEIHVSTPTRPPAEPWVALPSTEALERAETILGRVAPVLRPAVDDGAVGLDGDLVDAVVAIVSRHPLRQLELERMLARWAHDRVDRTLDALRERGELQMVERFGTKFWCAAGLTFPSPTANGAPQPTEPAAASGAGR
jgi:wyosine [tRNA(Phe)-imidazoG37] synthetase (radical SAM superfamily)